MNVIEKWKFKSIQILIDNKSFEKAIKKIDVLISKTTCIRKCINLKVQCLLELGRCDEAYEILKDRFPYVMIDNDDLIAIQHLSIIHQKLGNTIQANKYRYSNTILSGTRAERENFLHEREEKSNPLYDNFLSNETFQKDTLENIIIDNIQLLRITEAAVYCALSQYVGIDISENITSELAQCSQAEKFTHELVTGRRNIYCLISENSSQASMLRDYCLVKALAKLGHSLIHILSYHDAAPENYTVQKRFESQKRKGNIATIRIPKKEESVDINFLSDLIKFMNDQNDSEYPIVLFGNSELLMEINEDVGISKILEMYFRYYEEQPIPRKDCLLLGPYLSSVSHIWRYDVKKEFAKEAICDFSIIIPVRNSIKYLREVIETCLNQDYEGTYEILISDNGWHNGVDVLGLVKSINNEKIRYVKTPFDLSLAKSFEFAYLNARGKYLISIGSDDGLIKNSLSIVNLALKKFPENNIVMWSRAQYLWPISNYGKLKGNRLNFKNLSHLDIKEIDTEPLIKKAVVGKLGVFHTPNIYLATCIKKEHIGKLLGLTGKFEDGDGQDVYSGVLNLFVEDKITYLKYPVVISGGSEVGVGFTASIKPESIKMLNNVFKTRFRYYRYSNYYNKAYRKIFPIIGLGDAYLYFREYKKIERYNFKTVNLSNFEILELLYMIYYYINSTKLIDRNMYDKQLKKLALLYDEKIYRDYNKNSYRWKINLYLVKIAKKIIHIEKIRLFIIKVALLIGKFPALKKKFPVLLIFEQWLSMNSGTSISFEHERKSGIVYASNFLHNALSQRVKF